MELTRRQFFKLTLLGLTVLLLPKFSFNFNEPVRLKGKGCYKGCRFLKHFPLKEMQTSYKICKKEFIEREGFNV